MEHVAPAAPFPNIYLIGLMGSGKSTVGLQLARALHREFIDLDKAIEGRAQASISEIFREHGEPYFRELESECLQSIAHQNSLVVALGGGAILREQNRRLLQSTGLRIYLKVRTDTLLQRLSQDENRPLLVGLDEEEKEAKLNELEKIRSSFYEEANMIVENEAAPEAAIEKILATLPNLCRRSK